MPDYPFPRSPSAPIVEPLVPRLYGSTPSIFGAPLARGPEGLRGADAAFLGIPWSAPPPDFRPGVAIASYAGLQLTPSAFRQNSLKYGGCLPELDVNVFARLRLVDYGDADVGSDVGAAMEDVRRRVGEMLDAGCIALTIGGSSDVASYPVLQAIAERAGGAGGRSQL